MANMNISISWDDGTNLNISAADPSGVIVTDAMGIVERVIASSQAVQPIALEDPSPAQEPAV